MPPANPTDVLTVVVTDSDDRAIGYVLAAADSRRFEALLEREWWPTLRDRSLVDVDQDATPVSFWRVIRTAVLINLLNPKLTIFFFAFLPQFVPADQPNAVAHMLGLSFVFMAMTFGVFAIYGVFAAAARRHVLSRPAIVTAMRRAFAGAFAALGVRLALTERG